MKNFARFFLGCFVLAIVTVNCQRDTLGKILKEERALVVFLGDPSVDGCGWLLDIENSLYAPVNLEPGFQVDSLAVTVKYEIQSGTWNCGWRTSGYQKIKIKEIKVFQ